ncbi:hypothetical protein PsYK624_128940 [Phanerochaete sordida]|uniref:Uncharacterized protein n=1 Tax=Phanerochaete sordida TaxID=48140 RepID=A0A9P3GNJ5_9APHY|nr:hypothetical protein PsYK624_128940 [Phanerochaete sordida]
MVVLFAATLLARAAPAPSALEHPAAMARAGHLAAGAPMTNSFDRFCAKHPCEEFHDQKREGAGADAAAPSEDDAGAGSLDLAPEIDPAIEGLRDITGADGTFA